MSGAGQKRNGVLKLPMGLEDALRAALEVKPAEKKPPKRKRKPKKS